MSRASLLGWTALIGAALLAIAPRPPVDNSTVAISATRDERSDVYDDFRARFGADEVIVVYLRADQLSELPEAIETVESTLSEVEAIERVLGPRASYPDELLLIQDEELFDAESRRRIEGRLAAPLGRSLGLLRLERPAAKIYAFGTLAKTEVWAEVEAELGRVRDRLAPQGVRMVFGGSPLLNLGLDREGRRVDQTAVPILVGLFLVILIITLRSLRTTLCAFIPVGFTVLAADGAFALLGGTGNLVVNVAKPLLMVLLLASGLHVTVAFQHRLRIGQTRSEAAWGAAREKARGVALALFTTAVGFFSLSLAEVAPIRVLGMLTAGGLAAGGPLVLFTLPALLARFGPERPPPGPAGRRVGALEATLVAAVGWSVRRTGVVLVAATLTLVAAAFALGQLRPSTHPIAYFPADHPVRVSHDELSKAGAGLMTLEAVLDLGGETDAPPLLEIDRFASTATAISGVRGRVDLALFLREASFRTSGSEAVPPPAAASWLLEERPELGQSLRAGSWYRVALLLEPDSSAQDLDRVSARLRAIQEEQLPQAKLTLTGNYDLIVRSQRSLQETLVASLGATLLFMELVLLVALRSFRLALVALIPNALPVAANILVMWLLAIPLDVGTAMTGAVALGIAVDDTLHFLVAWKEEGREAAIVRTGRAIVLSTVVISAGFFALVPSDFLPTRNFALLSGVAMVVALVGDLLVLPPLLEWSGAQPAARAERGAGAGS